VARSFRFGVSVRRAADGADWREKARRAEALGYAVFLVPDHLADILPPWAALTVAAEAAPTIRVGTFVLNNDLRHPALVAREAAALDLLTDGRVELGLGAGHMQGEYEQIGLRFEPNAVRVERLAEAVAIVKRLLEGEEVSFSGVHYSLRGHRVWPRPAQSPRPPLLLGGNSRRLLELAGREADIVSFLGFSHRRGGREFDFGAFGADGTAERIDVVRKAAGSRFGELELNAVVQRVVVTDHASSAAAELADDLLLSVDDVLDSPYLLVGSVDAIADGLRARNERHGFTYWVVPEGVMDAFAPVIALLV
jgi:probable F420-dependent oxidoreductase